MPICPSVYSYACSNVTVSFCSLSRISPHTNLLSPFLVIFFCEIAQRYYFRLDLFATAANDELPIPVPQHDGVVLQHVAHEVHMLLKNMPDNGVDLLFFIVILRNQYIAQFALPPWSTGTPDFLESRGQ